MEGNAPVAWLLIMALLSGCGALGPGSDAVATLAPSATVRVIDRDDLRRMRSADETQAAATVAAASAWIADRAWLNAAMGATLRANYTPTPGLRPVVVSAAEMGSSLTGDMLDAGGQPDAGSLMTISDVDTARGVLASSGCSTGSVRQFSGGDKRIYVTARVTDLQAGSVFGADWIFQGRVLFRVNFTVDEARASLCIWFYATQEDFPFLPGAYSATIFVNGESRATAAFTIAGR